MPELLTRHAKQRCRARGISEAAISAALDYGNHRAVRGADIYTIGWRQVRFHAARGVDLSRWEGIEIVCAHDGRIITAYRNRNRSAQRNRRTRRAAAYSVHRNVIEEEAVS